MNSSLVIDKETRQKAAIRAKGDKLSVSAIARILLNDYAEGRLNVGIYSSPSFQVEEIDVDNETQGFMDNIADLWNRNKNSAGK